MDPKSQAWKWIESAIRNLGIKSILCDHKFSKGLEENTTLSFKNVEIVQTSLFSIRILHLERIQLFKGSYTLDIFACGIAIKRYCDIDIF